MNAAKKREKTLTEIEALGLVSQHDLANGHATQELMLSQEFIINRLPQLWKRGYKQKSRDAELMFKYAFQQLAKTPSLENYIYFKICPTASNSIDVVGAWLAEHQYKTALLEPTFDNLYLILKRRGVELTSLPEEELTHIRYLADEVNAIFLVNPNNPTGKILSADYLNDLIAWCATHNKILILDHSFRFFVPPLVDIYQLLIDAKISFICIEDTGKVWPTQEIKASLLFCAKDIYDEIAIIYDELFLCHSNFALQLLTEFLMHALHRGLDETVWKQVALRRAKFRDSLDGSILSIPPESFKSMLSVEWVKVGKEFVSDLALVDFLQASHLTILPGRQFYWNRKSQLMDVHYVRFALLKPEQEFLKALSCLQVALSKLNTS